MEAKTKADEIRALLDKARTQVREARTRRSVDEPALKAIDALAEAVALLVPAQGKARRAVVETIDTIVCRENGDFLA